MSQPHGGGGATGDLHVTVADLARALDAGALVLDVREPEEFAAGHVPGVELVPMQTIPQRLPDLPRDQPVYLICAVGQRSDYAARWLAAQGVDARTVDGGTAEWAATGRPLER